MAGPKSLLTRLASWLKRLRTRLGGRAKLLDAAVLGVISASVAVAALLLG